MTSVHGSRKVKFSKKSKTIKPTGFMLLSSALPERFDAPKFSLEEICAGAGLDYNFGKHTLRAAASTLNNCPRTYGRSKTFSTEGPLLGEIREIVVENSNRVPIEDYSPIAQQRIRSDSPTLGNDRKRLIKVKVLRYDDLSEDPYVLATIRRETKESIPNKAFKFLNRLQKEIEVQSGNKADERVMGIEEGLEKLLKCRGDLVSWRETPGVSLSLTQSFVYDFSGQTIILNSPEKLETGTVEYVEEMQRRINFTLGMFGNLGDFYSVINKKNFHNIEEHVRVDKDGRVKSRTKRITGGNRDRADSSVYIRNGRLTELRVTDLKSFAEGKWGLWAHPTYKERQLEETAHFYERGSSKLFNQIADNTMNLFGASSIKDLYYMRLD